jgi:phospholipase/carboxylesterase
VPVDRVEEVATGDHGALDRTSRRVVPMLQQAGYDVDYREFAGGHVVPADLAEQAAAWLVR